MGSKTYSETFPFPFEGYFNALDAVCQIEFGFCRDQACLVSTS